MNRPSAKDPIVKSAFNMVMSRSSAENGKSPLKGVLLNVESASRLTMKQKIAPARRKRKICASGATNWDTWRRNALGKTRKEI